MAEEKLPPRWAGWLVHLYTATGVLWAMLALNAAVEDRYGDAYWWLLLAVVIDGTDGPLARRLKVKETVPEIDGALLDNIIDYITWTLVPLLMIGYAGWLPDPAWPWLTAAAMGSLYAFSHTGAKEPDEGFFRGFPSYWNIVVFYVDTTVRHWGEWAVAALLVALGVLSVLPVHFVYPNRVKRFRPFFVWGSWLMVPLLFWMFTVYPEVPRWSIGVTAGYALIYTVLSVYLDLARRRS